MLVIIVHTACTLVPRFPTSSDLGTIKGDEGNECLSFFKHIVVRPFFCAIKSGIVLGYRTSIQTSHVVVQYSIVSCSMERSRNVTWT